MVSAGCELKTLHGKKEKKSHPGRVTVGRPRKLQTPGSARRAGTHTASASRQDIQQIHKLAPQTFSD